MDKKRITLLHHNSGGLSCRFKPYEPIVWLESEWVNSISNPSISDTDMEILLDENSTKEQVHKILHWLVR